MLPTMPPVKQELPDPHTHPFMTIAEAGACLGMSRRTAFRAAKDDRLPTIRLSRQRRVLTLDVYEILGRPIPDAERPPVRPIVAAD